MWLLASLGCVKRSLAGGSREGMLLLRSAETPLQSCVQLWGPQHNKDVELLEQVWWRAVKMV